MDSWANDINCSIFMDETQRLNRYSATLISKRYLWSIVAISPSCASNHPGGKGRGGGRTARLKTPESCSISRAVSTSRCVVVLGLPYPNPQDPELRERMHYMNASAAKVTAGSISGLCDTVTSASAAVPLPNQRSIAGLPTPFPLPAFLIHMTDHVTYPHLSPIPR